MVETILIWAGIITVIGWGLNLLTTLISFIVDLYHATPDLGRGLLACLAFSWLPFFVFVSGLIHFLKWAFNRGPA